MLEKGKRFIFDRDDSAGDSNRVQLPHAELFEAVRPGTSILIDDGKIRLNVLEADERADRQRSQGRRHGLRQQGRQRPRRASCRSRR